MTKVYAVQVYDEVENDRVELFSVCTHKRRANGLAKEELQKRADDYGSYCCFDGDISRGSGEAFSSAGLYQGHYVNKHPFKANQEWLVRLFVVEKDLEGLQLKDGMSLDEGEGLEFEGMDLESEIAKLGLNQEDDAAAKTGPKPKKSKVYSILSTSGKSGKPIIKSIHQSKESANLKAKSLLKEALLAGQKKNSKETDAFNLESSESAKGLFVGSYKQYSWDSQIEIKMVENDFFGDENVDLGGNGKKAPPKETTAKREWSWGPATGAKRART